MNHVNENTDEHGYMIIVHNVNDQTSNIHETAESGESNHGYENIVRNQALYENKRWAVWNRKVHTK